MSLTISSALSLSIGWHRAGDGSYNAPETGRIGAKVIVVVVDSDRDL